MAVNVNTEATVVRKDSLENKSITPFELGNFVQNSSNTPSENNQVRIVSKEEQDNNSNFNTDALSNQIKSISSQLEAMNNKISNIEQNGVQSKDLDIQIIQAMKDLKQYATFFEQATFQLETKILKTSFSLAKKIIGIEVGENSSAIAKETLKGLLLKLKTASKVTIHLNPKDYVMLKDDLNLEPFMSLQEDANVTAGGVVIASDLGNFDGSIDAKINSLMESLETLI